MIPARRCLLFVLAAVSLSAFAPPVPPSYSIDAIRYATVPQFPLRSLGQRCQTVHIIAFILHRVISHQFVLAIDGDLHVVADMLALPSFHQAGLRIGQRELFRTTFSQLLFPSLIDHLLLLQRRNLGLQLRRAYRARLTFSLILPLQRGQIIFDFLFHPLQPPV